MDESAQTDAELIARAQGGEVEAFGELYQRYLDPIYRYVRARVSEDQDAEDLCETVFLRSFESLGGYRDRGHAFSAYLYQVARNLLVDHYRRQPAQAADEDALEIASNEAGPETVVEQRERLKEVIEAMQALPPDYQEVIRLRVVLALPSATVGEWMGKSPGAIRVLLHRALKALREQVTDGAG